MAPARIDPARLVEHLPREGRVLVLGCAGESRLLADAVMAAGDELGALTFTGIFVPGLNHHNYLANDRCTIETFFLTPELKAAAPAHVRFLPLCYNDILSHLRAVPIDAALMMVAPPDADGHCSFGNSVDFLAELWPRIPIRIAQVNPAMPSTRGGHTIPFAALTAIVEAQSPLPVSPEGPADPVADAIARNIAGHVANGATLQTGLGKVPGAVLRGLCDHRDLRIHSGLIGDAVLDLIEAGALAPGVPITAGCAIGTERLYAALDRREISFAPVSVTHDALTIAGMHNFTAINSALEVDLFGQAYAELGPKGLMSGPGGASDFARAARLSPGGLRIVALASTAAKGAVSRIVVPGCGAGPVSLGRMDVDLVVTEHGAADLRARDYDARAAALIGIAAPQHREALARAWRDYANTL